MDKPIIQRYTSAISSKGSLFEETLFVFNLIDQGLNTTAIRERIVEQSLIGGTTKSTRESIWENIHKRYLGNEDILPVLAQMIVNAPNTQTQKLIMFYEFCLSTPILYDVTIDCIYPRYANGYSAINKSIIQQYFNKIASDHPELAEWSPQTRDKLASNILTILRDFGLLKGIQRKEFTRVYVPLPSFIYVLYRLIDNGLTTPQQLLETKDWKLFFLEKVDVVLLLDEATTAGHCTFKHRGDLYTLDLNYHSLEVCVDALTTKI